MSLVPPIHIALLDADQLYDTLFDAMQAQGWSDGMPTNALLVSGPSKTADIQVTLAYGAHGPKELVVLLLVNETEEGQCHNSQPLNFVPARRIQAACFRRRCRRASAQELPRRDGLPDRQARRPVSRIRKNSKASARSPSTSASTVWRGCRPARTTRAQADRERRAGALGRDAEEANAIIVGIASAFDES
jgi:hypothetical protein